jgi:hypothetical protein
MAATPTPTPTPPDFSEPIAVKFIAEREFATDLNQFSGEVSKFNLVPPSAVKNQSELTRRFSLPASTFQNNTNIFFMPPPNRKLRKDGLKSQPRDVMIETLSNRSSFKTWMIQHTSKFNVSTTDTLITEINNNTKKNAKTYVEFLFDEGKSFYKTPFTIDNSFTIIDNSFIGMDPLLNTTNIINYKDNTFSVNFNLDLVAGKPKEIKKIIRAKKCQKQKRRLDKALDDQGVKRVFDTIKDRARYLSTAALTGLVTLGSTAVSGISDGARGLWGRIRPGTEETSTETETPAEPATGGGKRKSKRKRKKGKVKKQRKTKKRQHRKPKQEA